MCTCAHQACEVEHAPLPKNGLAQLISCPKPRQAQPPRAAWHAHLLSLRSAGDAHALRRASHPELAPASSSGRPRPSSTACMQGCAQRYGTPHEKVHTMAATGAAHQQIQGVSAAPQHRAPRTAAHVCLRPSPPPCTSTVWLSGALTRYCVSTSSSRTESLMIMAADGPAPGCAPRRRPAAAAASSSCTTAAPTTMDKRRDPCSTPRAG